MTMRELLIGLTMITIVALTLTGLRIGHEAHSALPQPGLERSTSSHRLRPQARFVLLPEALDDWQGSAEGGLTDSIQASRLTVTQIDHTASRILVVDASGNARWMSVDRHITECLSPGDTIRAEARDGEPFQVVVLRRAWDELASVEN